MQIYTMFWKLIYAFYLLRADEQGKRLLFNGIVRYLEALNQPNVT